MDQNILEQVIESYQLPTGFERNDEQSIVSPTFAARTLFEVGGKQTITLKVRHHKSVNDAENSHASMVDYWKKINGSKQMDISGLGDDSCLVLTRENNIEGGATKDSWSIEMRWGGFSKSDQVEVLNWLESTLSSFYSALPSLSGNRIEGRPADHCEWSMPFLVKESLGSLSVANVASATKKMGITHASVGGISFKEVDAAYLAKFKQTIISAAAETRLQPEIIAATILAERRGLDTHVLSLQWFVDVGLYLSNAIKKNDITALHQILARIGETISLIGYGVTFLVNALQSLLVSVQKYFGVDEDWRDYVLSYLSDDVSLGLAQRQVNSIKRIGAYKSIPELLAQEGNLTFDVEIGRWLWNDKKAIRLAAHFIRTLANQMAVYADDKGGYLNAWVEDRSCGSFDLARYSEHSSDWSLLHVNFLGWKYNTGHMESEAHKLMGKAIWGDMFQLAYQDIREARIF